MDEFDYNESETGQSFDVSDSGQNPVIEHIIDLADGKGGLPEPNENALVEVPHVIEIKSDAIITTEDPSTFVEAEVGGFGKKWSYNDNELLLDAFRTVLNIKKFSNKNDMFIKGAHELQKRGISLTPAKFKLKYKSMLITYKRCRKNLIAKRKPPTWPYFKEIREIEQLRIEALASLDKSVPTESAKSRNDTTKKSHYPPNYNLYSELGHSTEANDIPVKSRYQKILPKPSINLAFVPGSSNSVFNTIPVASTSDNPSNMFKDKRQKQEYRKLSFLDELLQECDGAAALEKKYWTKMSIEEETECVLLGSIRDEIAEFRKDLVEGVTEVRNHLDTLAHIIINR